MKNKISSPFVYVGGKQYIADWIASHLDYNKECYIELFGGGGSVLFTKKPHKIEIFNDINEDIINFFLVLKDKREELVKELEKIPYSRKIFETWIKEDLSKYDSFERAVRWFYIQRSSFAAKSGCGWGYSFTKNEAKVYYNSLKIFNFFQERIQNVMLECRDFRDILNAITPDKEDKIMIYVDPPYFNKECYYKTYRFTKEDHYQLAEYLNKLKCSIAISYYPCDEVYKLYPEPKWNYLYKQAKKHSQKRVKTARKKINLLRC